MCSDLTDAKKIMGRNPFFFLICTLTLSVNFLWENDKLTDLALIQHDSSAYTVQRGTELLFLFYAEGSWRNREMRGLSRDHAGQGKSGHPRAPSGHELT